ncbi:MAG: glycosyltransferase family 39 protein [Thermomicrobiales bacterium]|nr:glycosyltransferase family 39 protein [Thermomicrobiales bacterium]
MAHTAGGRIRGWWQREGRVYREETDLADDSVRANAWVPIAMLALVVAAFLFRYTAAEHLSSHVDESASVLAAEMVAEKGIPLFPSDTLYLQGATISYLLAPLIALDIGGLSDLLPLRMLSVFAGTLAVFFAFKLGKTLTGSAVAGFVIALMIAVDPASVRWGGMVRMYALLQLVALVVIWLFLRALLRPPRRNELAILVAVFWFGVFTHIAICLLLPGMVVGAFLTYGRDLQNRRRDVSVALAACFGAPVVMLGINKLFEPSNEAVSDSLPGVSFVGDFLFSFDQILHPSFQSWKLLFSYDDLGTIVSGLVVMASCVLVGRHFLGEPAVTAYTIMRRRIVATLFLIYWLPIVAVAALATEQNERYLLHIHPVGLLLVVILVYDLIDRPFPALGAARARMAAAPGEIARPWRPRRVYVAPTTTAGERSERAGLVALPGWLSLRAIGIASFAGVALIGAAVRISHLSNLSLWLDEGFSVLYSRQEWAAVSGTKGFYSPHPPGYFTLVKVSDLLFADEIAGRMISVIAGIATIPVFYLLMAKVLDRRAAFVSALVLALSPIHLYYSQEARMYALVVFLIAVTYLALVSYNHRPHWAWAAVYGVAASLALWVDYSSFYALAPQVLYILVQLYRHRRAAAPLFVAGVLAVLSYAPWIPQVLDSVDSANLVERRESYLGVDSSRITTALLAMMGYAGDGSYFQTFRETAWNRWPDSRGILLIAALPVIGLGIYGLWRRWEATVIVGGLLSTMLVGIWVSLISPGFAERTVLTTVLGWAALLGAAFSAKTSLWIKGIASLSLVAVLLVQTSTIDVIYNGAVKQLWTESTDDVAMAAPLGFPVVTYSYGAVADTLLDVYHPELTGTTRVVTIRDGGLEDVLSNGVIPEVGLTRTYDLPAGKLGEALPDTPENDLIWYLYYTREGESEVRAAIQRIGYKRVLFNHYVAPRYQVFLELYARPGADLGEVAAIDASFAVHDGGWVLPPDGATVGADATGAPQLTLVNQSFEGREAFHLVDTTGPTIATFSAEVLTTVATDDIGVFVSCLSAAGTELSVQMAEVPGRSGSAVVWRSVLVSALCPEETTAVRLTFRNTGFGEIVYRAPELRLLPIPR